MANASIAPARSFAAQPAAPRTSAYRTIPARDVRRIHRLHNGRYFDRVRCLLRLISIASECYLSAGGGRAFFSVRERRLTEGDRYSVKCLCLWSGWLWTTHAYIDDGRRARSLAAREALHCGS